MRKPEDGEKKKKNKIPTGILFVGGIWTHRSEVVVATHLICSVQFIFSFPSFKLLTLGRGIIPFLCSVEIEMLYHLNQSA
jgi:hypothetical protein